MTQRGFGHAKRAKYVNFRAFRLVVFHNRDMFVRRRVINRLRAMLREYLIDPHGVGHAGKTTPNDRPCTSRRCELGQSREFCVDLEEIEFAVVDEHKFARPEREDLSAQFAANRAARAGDENTLAANILRKKIRVRRHRLATEEIFNRDRTQLINAHASLGDLCNRRHRKYAHPGGSGTLKNTSTTLTRARRKCHEQRLNTKFAEHALERLRFVHANSTNRTTRKHGIVIEKRNNM